MPHHTRLVPFFIFFGPAYQTSWVRSCPDVIKLVLLHCVIRMPWRTTVGIMHDWMSCHCFPNVLFDWSTQTNRGGKSFERSAAKRHFEVFYFLVTLNTVWYSCYVQGLGGVGTLAQHKNETHLIPSPQHHQRRSILLKVSFKNTSRAQTDMLTEESPQELGRAGF